jgi:hypothetical protein
MDVSYPGRFVSWTFCNWAFGNWMFCNWTFCNWTFCGCTKRDAPVVVNNKKLKFVEKL